MCASIFVFYNLFSLSPLATPSPRSPNFINNECKYTCCHGNHRPRLIFLNCLVKRALHAPPGHASMLPSIPRLATPGPGHDHRVTNFLFFLVTLLFRAMKSVAVLVGVVTSRLIWPTIIQ